MIDTSIFLQVVGQSYKFLNRGDLFCLLFHDKEEWCQQGKSLEKWFLQWGLPLFVIAPRDHVLSRWEQSNRHVDNSLQTTISKEHANTAALWKASHLGCLMIHLLVHRHKLKSTSNSCMLLLLFVEVWSHWVSNCHANCATWCSCCSILGLFPSSDWWTCFPWWEPCVFWTFCLAKVCYDGLQQCHQLDITPQLGTNAVLDKHLLMVMRPVVWLELSLSFFNCLGTAWLSCCLHKLLFHFNIPIFFKSDFAQHEWCWIISGWSAF